MHGKAEQLLRERGNQDARVAGPGSAASEQKRLIKRRRGGIVPIRQWSSTSIRWEPRRLRMCTSCPCLSANPDANSSSGS